MRRQDTRAAQTQTADIPHKLDIRTPGELYAAMVAFPLVACCWEADCLIGAHRPESDPVGMCEWQAHWWDACSYNLGYSLTRLLADISVPEVWETGEARRGYPRALETVKTAAIESYIGHNGNYLEALGCLMARLARAAKQVETEHGYPHDLMLHASEEMEHASETERHLRSCLS